MYEVISKDSGQRIALCEQPHYIRLNPNSGAFVQCNAAQAEGIAADGTAYSLDGKLKGRPEVKLCKLDAGAIMSLAEKQDSEILKIKAALCELDLAGEEPEAEAETETEE